MYDVYPELRKRFFAVCERHNLPSETVRIKARVLSSEEAIGNPEEGDFPLQKGKECLMQAEFEYRILDMDPDNIGTRKFDAVVEGPEATVRAMTWADLLLVTGTTLVNGTINDFLSHKQVLFYGTTIAGAAHLMNWDRFCAKST